jgi:F-type H+-transporting ATPase subunit a
MSLLALPTLSPLAAGDDPLEHILPHALPWHVGPVTLTNHLVMLGVAGILMLLLFPLAARSRSRVPSGLRNLVESVLQYIREQVARPSLHEATDRYVPFLWTVFFLVLFSNLLGLLPIDPIVTAVLGHPLEIGGHPAHFGGTPTGNISITAGLAVCSFLLIQIGGVREQGLAYFKHFAPPVPWPLLFLLVPLEILGAFVKPFALAIRLFANMIAGHIVLAVVIGFTTLLASGLTGLSVPVSLVSVVGAVALGLLEVFVAFLQAYIFTYLTTLFVGMAVHPEH